MDLYPRDRLTSSPTLSHRGQPGAVGKDLSRTVAIDAGLCRREIRVRCNLNKTMTVSTVHSKLLHMKSVGKRHRLVGLVTDTGVLRSEIIPDSEGNGRTDNQHTHKEL